MSAVRRDAVRVVVPATSANLGPAFDSAGLALAVYDDLVAMATEDEGVLVEVSGEGAESLPRDEQHLVVRSMQATFAAMDIAVPGFVLRCINSIPHGRGLGSSAAAIVGGIVLARAMVDDGHERLTDDDVLQLALAQEPHPDNIAAALHGGLTIAWLEAEGHADVARMDVHPDLHPVVMVPSASLSTAQARTLLPEFVSLEQATVNIGRSALLVHALTADPTRLMAATEDRIHQASRAAAYRPRWRSSACCATPACPPSCRGRVPPSSRSSTTRPGSTWRSPMRGSGSCGRSPCRQQVPGSCR